MSLIEEAIAAGRKGPACQTGQWLLTLTPKDSAEVVDAMADPRPTHAALHRAIRARWPQSPGAESVTRHRKGECSCATR